jgi:Skp family chaperone for outer membrane proteins
MNRRAAVGVVAGLLAAGVGYQASRAEPDKPRAVPAARIGYVCLPELTKGYKRWATAAGSAAAGHAERVAKLTGLRDRASAAAARAAGAPDGVKAELEQQAVVAQRAFEDAARAAQAEDDRLAEAELRALYAEIRAAVAAVAVERGLTAVHGYPFSPATLARDAGGEPSAAGIGTVLLPPAVNVLYVDPAADLTAELLARLNARPAK